MDTFPSFLILLIDDDFEFRKISSPLLFFEQMIGGRVWKIPRNELDIYSRSIIFRDVISKKVREWI